MIAVLAIVALMCAFTVSATQAAITSYIATTMTAGAGAAGMIRIMSADGSSYIQSLSNAALWTYPSGIAFAPNGDLYAVAVNSSSVDVVDKFSYNGDGTWATTPTQFCTLPDVGGNLVVDSSNNVYVLADGSASAANKMKLWAFNASGASTWTITMPGNNANSFDIRMAPAGIGGAGGGDVWVVRPDGSGTTPGACAFNPTTGALDRQILNSYTPDEWIQGMDFGPDGNAYFCTPGYSVGDIIKYNTSTNVTTAAVASDPAHLNHGHNWLSNCFGADYNGDGTSDLYCGDYNASNIAVYSGVDMSYLGSISNGSYNVRRLTSWTVPVPVPEPSSLLMLVPGVAGMLALVSRKRHS